MIRPTDEQVEDVLFVARAVLYPGVFDPEDGIRAGSVEKFREWLDLWLDGLDH